jgi:hypothetical protein
MARDTLTVRDPSRRGQKAAAQDDKENAEAPEDDAQLWIS